MTISYPLSRSSGKGLPPGDTRSTSEADRDAQTLVRTDHLNSGSAVGQAKGRRKIRIITNDIGHPMNGVHSLHQFLCAMYDACAVQRNLYRKRQILHRDINDENIMFAPDMGKYRERSWKGYAEVRFVNQVLAKDKNVDPEPACILVDIGNSANLKADRGRDALTECAGNPKFIARSVSSGQLLDDKDFPSKGVDMPSLEGSLDDHPAWKEWESILHPSLARLAPMLAGMFEYIQPEWAYRREMNPEHVHEALMRLLLTEIVNIKKDGSDIDIVMGGRATPPLPRRMSR
ncbi:hypothetical protein RSAG8_04766, partial [Rhizoctonia solani AG-8 WAC10335]